MLSFIPTGAGYQHSMVHGHKLGSMTRQYGELWGIGHLMFASPTRAPKVGRLHLTSYGPTIICSS